MFKESFSVLIVQLVIRGGMDSKSAHEFGREKGFWANIRAYKLE
jgi:hypothetical protein